MSISIFKKYTPTPINTIADLKWESLIGVHRLDSTEELQYLLAKFREYYVLPELMALFGGDYGGFVLKCTDTNKISPSATILHWIELAKASQLRFRDGTPITPDILRGILNFCCIDQRSSMLIKTTTQLKTPRFSSAVPLVLSAFKEYRSIPYKQWDLLDPKLDIFVDTGLAEILQWSQSDRSEFPDRDTLLKYLEVARTYKGGAKAGTQRTLNVTYSIPKNDDAGFSALHNKLRCLLMQTWVFQPHAYTDLGIFNIDDIDAKPVSLVTGTVLADQAPAVAPAVVDDDDWLAPYKPIAPKVYGSSSYEPSEPRVYASRAPREPKAPKEPKALKPPTDEGIPWE